MMRRLWVQMGLVSTLHSTIIDKFHDHFATSRRRILLLVAVCLAMFLLALSLCTNVSIIIVSIIIVSIIVTVTDPAVL